MSTAVIRNVLLALATGILSLSCTRNTFDGDIIAVELLGEEIGSFDDARLIAFDPARTEKKVTVLSKEFESACSPALSHDARFLFFQGKKEAGQKWQIWRMDLHTKKIRSLTNLQENCTDPAPLPDGSIVFSRDLTANGRQYSALYSCDDKGAGLQRLTFMQGKNIHASVLGEGRVLFSSSQIYPSITAPDLMIMRPDGTKSEIYHIGTSADYPVSRGAESADGYIYFINNRGSIMRVLHRRPLHTAEKPAENAGGTFAAVTPLEGSECLVSWRSSADHPFAIYKMDMTSNSSPVLIRQGEKHLTEAILVKAKGERPRILPTEVVGGKPTGLIMSQDINFSMLSPKPGLMGDTIATHLRISGIDGDMAIVEVKEDGSVYLEMDADTPFRFEALNKMGETVRGPSRWIYLRPDERRACTGCHGDPELAPKNFQPLAVKEPPVLVSEKKKP